ncbi:MAG: hypothetical protein AAB692_05670 [Patescibacteria group bacterium]
MFFVTNQTKRRIFIKVQPTIDPSRVILVLYHLRATEWPSLLSPRVNPGKSRKFPAIHDPNAVKVLDRIGLRCHIAYLAGNPHLVIIEEVGLAQ